MQKFHLNFSPDKPGFHIDHNSRVFLIGSCFSENIGNYLDLHKFQTLSNPSGILFNPESIYLTLHNLLHRRELREEHILFRNSLYYSFLHHSSVFGHSKEELIERIREREQLTHDFLATSNVVIITFGSAFVYHHRKLDECVANCHKQPHSDFDKKLLPVNQVVARYSEFIKDLKEINPSANIVFTISPVKYLRDGIVQNNISKSVLVLAVHELCKKNGCYYFPSYELVNDDLRDYRFYREDLAHPNDSAIKYVWEKFSDCFFNDTTRNLNELIRKLKIAEDHRLMNEYSDEAQKLAEYIRKQKEEIKKMNPNIQF